MAPARRLAWIAGAGAAALAIAIAAFVALPDRAAAPGAPGASAGSGGSAAGARPDAAAADPHGAAPAGGDGGEATRVVASARAEAAAGNLVQARALLTRAYALDPRPVVLLELAAIEFQTGHCREARRAAQRVAAEAPDAIADQARQLLGTIGRCD